MNLITYGCIYIFFSKVSVIKWSASHIHTSIERTYQTTDWNCKLFNSSIKILKYNIWLNCFEIENVEGWPLLLVNIQEFSWKTSGIIFINDNFIFTDHHFPIDK